MSPRRAEQEQLPIPADHDQAAQARAYIAALARRIRLVRRELAEVDRRMLSDRRELKKLITELDSIRETLET